MALDQGSKDCCYGARAKGFDTPFIPAVSQQQLKQALKQLSTSCPQSSCKDSVELAFAELNSSIGHQATAESVAIQRCCTRGISACITKNAICSFSARLSHRKPQFLQKLQGGPNVNDPWHFDSDKRLSEVCTLADKKVNERSVLIGLSLQKMVSIFFPKMVETPYPVNHRLC